MISPRVEWKFSRWSAVWLFVCAIFLPWFIFMAERANGVLAKYFVNIMPTPFLRICVGVIPAGGLVLWLSCMFGIFAESWLLRILCGMMAGISVSYTCVFLPIIFVSLWAIILFFWTGVALLGIIPCIPLLTSLAFFSFRRNLQGLSVLGGESEPVGAFAFGFVISFAVCGWAVLKGFAIDMWCDMWKFLTSQF